MKKITAAVFAVCVLLSLSPQLTAKEWEIEIKVAVDLDGDFFIDMGEKYAYAVPEEASIRWTCIYPFALTFKEEVKTTRTSIRSLFLRKKAFLR